MHPIFTVAVSICAILSMISLCVAAEADNHSLLGFLCWTGSPYLGHCALAFARRLHRSAIFVATLISGFLASVIYWQEIWPMVAAKRRGVEVMNCGPPLVEFGCPLLQWIFVMFLFVITRRGR